MFFQNLVQMGGFELNHHWHGINVLSILECALLAACLCTMLGLFFRFMRKSKRLTALSLIGALSFATAAYAANTALSALSASGALAGANLIYVVQTVGVGGVKATMTQVATFINSLFSGDFTCTSGGVCTVTKINNVTPPSPIGSVTSLTGACGVTATPNPIIGIGTVSANVTATNNTATTDTITNAMCGQVRTESNASPVAVAITTAGFVSGNYFTGKNLGAGVATYTPSAGTINGLASIACGIGQGFDSYFDGTNFITLNNTCNPVVALALATGAITSATCTSAQTVAYPGLLTTDVVVASFNGDPTAVTGYVPLTAGMLTIIVYPTANTINVKVCNNTSGSVTPGAITLNLSRGFR